MKVLKLSLVLWILFSSLYANENNLKYNRYLSEYKQKEFIYDYKKSELESLKLRDSWIVPLKVNYSYSKSNPYIGEQTLQNASVRMDQPIFRSGGIIYGIKFAGASRLFNDYTIDGQKRKMLKETIATLLQIKQYELREKKQKLQIANAKINLQQKKEEYLSGQLDSGFLDDAIIQKNLVTQALYDIETTKEKLIAAFHSLSDLDYKKVAVPYLELITEDEFLKYNIDLKLTQAAIQKSKYAKYMTSASYLPSVNFTASYNWNKEQHQQFSPFEPATNDENHYYSYGFNISMPLDFNTFRTLESARVDYLKSKVLLLDKQRELDALFKQVMQNIENYDKKIALSQENVDLYSKLLEDTRELYSAGYKTMYDVNTLQNSLNIQKIDKKIYEIDKQLELLTLYEMYAKIGE